MPTATNVVLGNVRGGDLFEQGRVEHHAIEKAAMLGHVGLSKSGAKVVANDQGSHFYRPIPARHGGAISKAMCGGGGDGTRNDAAAIDAILHRAAKVRRQNHTLHVSHAASRATDKTYLLVGFGKVLLRASKMKAVGNDAVDGGVECEPDVGAGNFEVASGIAGEAVAPVDYAVVLGIDRRLDHRFGNLRFEGADEIAGAVGGVAVGKNLGAMVLKDLGANQVGGRENGAMRDYAPEGRSNGDDRSDIVGTLMSDGAGDDTTQTMTDDVDLSIGLAQGLVDGAGEVIANE